MGAGLRVRLCRGALGNGPLQQRRCIETKLVLGRLADLPGREGTTWCMGILRSRGVQMWRYMPQAIWRSGVDVASKDGPTKSVARKGKLEGETISIAWAYFIAASQVEHTVRA